MSALPYKQVDIDAYFFDKQKEALNYLGPASPVDQLLYGGGAGGGKSRLGAGWQILRRLKYPGTRGVMGRAILKTLKETTLVSFYETMQDWGMKEGEVFTLNNQTNIISFFNGSEILLKDLFFYPSDPNLDDLGSLEITDAFIDEAAQVTKKVADILTSRCRYKLAENGLKKKILMTCNPSKTWLYNDFYLPHKENRIEYNWSEERPEEFRRAFLQSLPTDNPKLDPDYLNTLYALPDYDKQRLLYGNWEFDDDTAKLFFTSDIRAMFRTEPPREKEESYITADVARFGADKSVIMLWKGLRVLQVSTLEKQGVDVVSQFIRDLRDTHNVPLKNIVVDEDGIGGGVVDNLRCTGFVNHSKATDAKKYVSIKHECYFKLASYIASGKINIEGANEAMQAAITRELESIKRHNSDKDTRLCVTPKDEIKRMHGFSPDHADCMMMRMFFELHPNRGKYVIV